jgi:hypothetical protein
MSSDLTMEEMMNFKSKFKPYTGGSHPGACHGDKIDTRRAKFGKLVRPRSYEFGCLTQHERVNMGRAARLGRSVKEYELRF